ncbi:MAG: ATP-binding protein [Bdellovibrionota bacterium]
MDKSKWSVAEWGIDSATTAETASHIRLTNVILAFLFGGSIFQTALLFCTGAVQAAMLNSTAPFVFGGGLLLMRAGHTLLARTLVLSLCYFFSFAIAIILGPQSQFQLVFLFGSALSIIFFSNQERWLLIYCLLLPIFCFGWLEYSNYEPVFGLKRAALSEGELLFMRSSSVFIVWLVMVLHFYYFIRRRRITQEQLIISAKMVAMGRMAAGIAHEVNNPLQRIVSHADRLQRLTSSGTVSHEQIDSLADQIQSVAMRIASIVKGLLTLSRDASGDPMLEVTLKSVLSLSLDYCRARLESHKIEFKIGDFDDACTVIGREAQLSEVILNLLSNAYDAVIDTPQPLIVIDVKAEKDFVEIAVSDSGPGIPHNVRHRIFDPFFTTKPVGQGTGLGLSVSQGIMEAHGGSLRYDHRAELTRFVIRVPRGPDYN